MHPLGLDRDWWVPLERFIAPERRLFSLLLIFSVAIHGAGMALVGIRGVRGTSAPFTGPSVTLMPSGGGGGAGTESLRLSLKLEDPSSIALPRLVSLFEHAAPPAALAAPLDPAPPEGLVGVRQILPGGVGGIGDMAARMPLERPRIARPPEIGLGTPSAVGRILVGSGLARRLLGSPTRLETVRGQRPLEGPTVVSIGVGADGVVREAVVVVSSGSSAQDGEALRLARGMKFSPNDDRETAWSSVGFYWPEAAVAAGEGP